MKEKSFKPVTRYFALYLLFFISPIALAFFSGSSESPTRLILGEWKEESWVYEKVDTKNPEKDGVFKMVSEKVKEEVMENLIIHKAETWKFTPDRVLDLHDSLGGGSSLVWSLKGRGHVLSIQQRNGLVEHYNVDKLSKDEMVLYFDSDIHAKGIIKMTFKRVDN